MALWPKVLLGVAALTAISAAAWTFHSRGIFRYLKSEEARRADSQRGIEAGRESAPNELTRVDATLGDPMFIRIFKESSEFELWVQPGGVGEFMLARQWPVARWSGTLGPKLKEGDGQAPEGFYYTNSGSLNPNSSYHLSFNINYPNADDRTLGRTGSFIMVHGGRASIGCFAMTDPVIEVIYASVEAALANGQDRVPIHVFPFRMTPERVAQIVDDLPWKTFWLEELRPEYQRFETTRRLSTE